MIFCNKNFYSSEKEMEFGKIFQIVLGEYGRGRKELRLPCPEGTNLSVGCNFDFSIGETKSGRPRINRKKDGRIFLLICTKGRYTRRGDGWFGAWDGDAGRIGSWDAVLCEILGQPKNEWFRIRTGGGGYGIPPQFININPKGFFLFDNDEDARQFADEMDIEFPNLENEPTEEFSRI